jgi:hypothetical protein
MKIAHVTPLLLQKRFRGTRQGLGPASCVPALSSGTGLILIDPKKKASLFFQRFLRVLPKVTSFLPALSVCFSQIFLVINPK